MFDSIASPYLGETASNLRRVFEFAGSGRFVVMFDEFDIDGKKRDDPHEHGEIKRLVNNFMQMMDDFKGRSIILAATDHLHLLGRALWRSLTRSCTTTTRTRAGGCGCLKSTWAP